MKTFELTYSIKTSDDSDIDLIELERDLANYGSTDMNFIELDMIEPMEVHVTFEMEADDLGDCPDELELLNDEDIVSDPELYITELVSHTSY